MSGIECAVTKVLKNLYVLHFDGWFDRDIKDDLI